MKWWQRAIGIAALAFSAAAVIAIVTIAVKGMEHEQVAAAGPTEAPAAAEGVKIGAEGGKAAALGGPSAAAAVANPSEGSTMPYGPQEESRKGANGTR